MKARIAKLLYRILVFCIAKRRRPDMIIGEPKKPYLLRWWVFGTARQLDKHGRKRPRRPFGFSVYLHCFMHPDDDRAHHDHPWNWWSYLLRGPYFEHRNEPRGSMAYSLGASEVTLEHHSNKDETQVIRRYETGSFRGGKAEDAHRIDLLADNCVYTPQHGFADTFEWMTEDEYMAVLNNSFVPCWTLFITSKLKRDWGFHCPKGWVPWWEFTAADSGGTRTGVGCGD